MSYMKLNNARIRENGKKRSLFDKVNELKGYIKTMLPELDDDKVLGILSRCRTAYEGKVYYGRRGGPLRKTREMTVSERIIYDYLLKNGMKPNTVYRWFLASRIPSDIQALMKSKRISVKQAFQMSANRLRNRLSSEGLIMMEEIRRIIRKY